MKRFISINGDRFRAFCHELGGQGTISTQTGMSRKYITSTLRRDGGRMRQDVVERACQLHAFPMSLLLGDGSDEEFRAALDAAAARKRAALIRKTNHQCCDSSCKGCVYSGWVGITDTPPERFCVFYLITGLHRGCPAGKGCTRKKKGAVSYATISIPVERPLVSV